MSERGESSDARERVLATASVLFRERGYAAVTLRDIAHALNMTQPALYYHVPGGKEELFVEVTSRTFTRCRAAIDQISREPLSLHGKLLAMASWLLNEPPLDVVRLARTDLPAIAPASAQRLLIMGEHALASPLMALVQEAQQQKELRPFDSKIFVTAFLATLDALHEVPQLSTSSHDHLASQVVTLFLQGIAP